MDRTPARTEEPEPCDTLLTPNGEAMGATPDGLASLDLTRKEETERQKTPKNDNQLIAAIDEITKGGTPSNPKTPQPSDGARRNLPGTPPGGKDDLPTE